MLLDVLDACGDETPAWKAMRDARRAARAALRRDPGAAHRAGRHVPADRPLDRLPVRRVPAARADGAAAARCPRACRPRRSRGALTAVIRRTIEAPGTFDADGWLRIGFCGHQPGVGETYISTGSLYLCAVGLLPLGLAPADAVLGRARRSRGRRSRAWSGQAFPIDHALAT